MREFIRINGYTSIACAVAGLPLSFRQNVTFMHCSMSDQGADPKNPRAILISPDGRLSISFNGDPSQAGFTKMEMIENSRAENNAWKMAELKESEFLSNQKIEINPSRCTRCHGNPPKPIWGAYPTWHCAYGGNDDMMININLVDKLGPQALANTIFKAPEPGQLALAKKIKEDSKNFAEFLRTQYVLNPRYAAIQFWKTPVAMGPYSSEHKTDFNDSRANLRLSKFFAAHQANSIASRIQMSPNFKKFKYSFIVSLLNCRRDAPPFSFSAKQFADLAGVANNQWHLEFSRGLRETYSDGAHESLIPYVNQILARAIINEGIQLPPGREAKFPEFPKEERFPGLNELQARDFEDLSSQAPKLCERFWPKAQLEQNGILAEKLRALGQQKNLISLPNQASLEQKIQMACKLSAETKIGLDLESLASRTKSHIFPDSAKSCIECHTQTEPSGLYLDFSDPKKFFCQSIGFKSKFGYGSLLESVKAMVDVNQLPAHEGGHRMPYGRNPLTAVEARELIEFLSKGSTQVKSLHDCRN